ncbi:efflux RND transporter permease subunit, partial [Enterobacter kobei]|uniref:efflux RND transporter permease subunit n=1 Tax=Enterobacter kobei TaxID=208224 RepID=UPI000A66BF4E
HDGDRYIRWLKIVGDITPHGNGRSAVAAAQNRVFHTDLNLANLRQRNALVGLIALSGILMRNTLILIGQIDHNQKDGLDPFHAVVEATVQRARPVLLTALAAVLAFIPLTHSVFWGTLAYTLIGGTLGGTAITLVFLPAMYAIWFRIRPAEQRVQSPAENV